MHNHIDTYRRRGFVEITTDSGTGSYILVNEAQRRVVKFNQDPAYDKFAEFARANPGSALPAIFLHEKPVGEFKPLSNDEYTVTELELLVPLSIEEQQLVLGWIQAEFRWLQAGAAAANLVDDSFGLRSTLHCLRLEAARTGVSMDVLKGSNFMKREIEDGQFVVFTDPYN